MIKKNNCIILLVLMAALLVNCKGYAVLTYWNMNEQTKEDLVAEKEYMKIAPNNLAIVNDSILLKFNIKGFRNKQIILNKHDTINFKGLTVDCGEINRRVPKSIKKIILNMEGNIINIPIKNEYNFIKVQGINNHKWNIIYSQFFPKFDCM